MKEKELRDDLEEKNTMKLFQWTVKEWGANISGSYLLKFLCNGDYVPGDIDIYIPIRIEEDDLDIPQKQLELAQQVHLKISEKMTSLGMEVEKVEYHTAYANTILENKSHIAMTMQTFATTDALCVQFILVMLIGETLIDDFFNKSFDLSFCIARYDGEKIHTERLYEQIRKVGSVINDAAIRASVKWYYRMKKYQERGFSFRFPPQYEIYKIIEMIEFY